jgi:hypothetical protein
MNASSGVVHEASSLLSPMLILDAAILAIIAARYIWTVNFFAISATSGGVNSGPASSLTNFGDPPFADRKFTTTPA